MSAPAQRVEEDSGVSRRARDLLGLLGAVETAAGLALAFGSQAVPLAAALTVGGVVFAHGCWSMLGALGS